MKTVALHNLGCKVNSYELDVMQQYLQKDGYEIVNFDQKADIYIINTCTVTNIADRKSRQMIHRAKRQNPDAIVVAVGCYVQTASDKVQTDPHIDLAIGNNKKNEIVTILKEFLQTRQKTLEGKTILDLAMKQEYEEMSLSHTSEHTRAYIKIQDGCNQFCSYCVIPYARGRVRSRSKENVLREVETLAKAGYKEVVLTGIHISSYGLDISGESYNVVMDSVLNGDGQEFAFGEFLELVRMICEVDGITRVRFGSLEPRIVTEEFVKAIYDMKKICPHFHLSLQSGSDTVLKRMNRRYTAKQFAESAAILRKFFDNPAITTDIIVGFPGETEEEFLQTKEFAKEIGFFEMHVFPYSKREGTAAAKMQGQLSEKEKKERSAVLLQLDDEMSLAYRKSYIGKEMKVLFEQTQMIDGVEYQVGHTDNYIKVALRCNEDLTNCEITCKLIGMLDECTVFAQKN